MSVELVHHIRTEGFSGSRGIDGREKRISPPVLTEDESTMIRETFDGENRALSYTPKGGLQEPETRGFLIDRKA